MSAFHASPSALKVTRKDSLIYVENEYIRWGFDCDHGGDLFDARVKNGSGKNLLRKSMRTSLSLPFNGVSSEFATNVCPAEHVSVQGKEDCVHLIFTRKLANAEGTVLPGITAEHQVHCSPWGYSTHKEILRPEKELTGVSSVHIGSFTAADHFDCCAVRERLLTSPGPSGQNQVRWHTLYHGKRWSDESSVLLHWLPLSMILFERGVEGLEFSLGDDLAQWDQLCEENPGRQYFGVVWVNEENGYVVTYCPMNIGSPGKTLKKDISFTYHLTLPHVKPHIVPFRPGSWNLLNRQRDFEHRWPAEDELDRWHEAGIDLMRLHNDGNNWNNGLFWRDCNFPPYPQGEIVKMKQYLKSASSRGIATVPYFSVKEFHPEAAGFEQNANAWGRKLSGSDELLKNKGPHCIFGAQMCLKSPWMEFRKKTIEQVLRGYDFQGVYYDWCAGIECCNPAHGARHWDNDELLAFLEWSHKQVGNGEMYLHLTYVPSLAAENMGSLLLTEESRHPLTCPEMFSPHVHFMNIAPRQICEQLGPETADTERRKLGLCAILHHASVSSTHPVYLELYSAEWMQNVTKYKRHTAPGEGIFEISEGAGISAYWKEDEILIVAVNLTEQTMTASWSGRTEKMNLAFQPDLHGMVELEPLSMKTILLKREMR